MFNNIFANCNQIFGLIIFFEGIFFFTFRKKKMTKVVLYSILFLSIFPFDISTEISYKLKNENLVYQLKMKNGKQV